jgi:hypothetical protein
MEAPVKRLVWSLSISFAVSARVGWEEKEGNPDRKSLAREWFG